MAKTHLKELDVEEHNGTTEGLYLGGVLLTKTATQLNSIVTSSPAAAIADITISATGTQIATAVNGILAVLRARGFITT